MILVVLVGIVLHLVFGIEERIAIEQIFLAILIHQNYIYPDVIDRILAETNVGVGFESRHPVPSLAQSLRGETIDERITSRLIVHARGVVETMVLETRTESEGKIIAFHFEIMPSVQLQVLVLSRLQDALMRVACGEEVRALRGLRVIEHRM